MVVIIVMWILSVESMVFLVNLCRYGAVFVEDKGSSTCITTGSIVL